jgi:hypothetical protein
MVPVMGILKLTEAKIEAGRSAKGGFAKSILKGWGVPWPPPSGWKRALLAGEMIPRGTPGSKNDVDVDHRVLLEQVVLAIINAGHGEILNELPDVCRYYGSRVPTVADVIGGRPETSIITGDIAFDDKVYSFRCARVVTQVPSQNNLD